MNCCILLSVSAISSFLPWFDPGLGLTEALLGERGLDQGAGEGGPVLGEAAIDLQQRGQRGLHRGPDQSCRQTFCRSGPVPVAVHL